MGKASTLTTRKKKMIQQRPIHKLLSLSSSFLKYWRQSIVKSSGHHCTLKWTLSSASITMLPIINSSLESHYLKIYFDKLMCYIYVYNIYIYIYMEHTIVGLSHSHLHHVYYFIMLIALNITIITFLAFLKLLNKKNQNRTNMLFGSINIVKIIFFYLRDCDTSLSDCIECIHPVWLWLTS